MRPFRTILSICSWNERWSATSHAQSWWTLSFSSQLGTLAWINNLSRSHNSVTEIEHSSRIAHILYSAALWIVNWLDCRSEFLRRMQGWQVETSLFYIRSQPSNIILSSPHGVSPYAGKLVAQTTTSAVAISVVCRSPDATIVLADTQLFAHRTTRQQSRMILKEYQT